MPTDEPKTHVGAAPCGRPQIDQDEAAHAGAPVQINSMIRDVRPEPATGDPKKGVYVFEAPVSIKRRQGDDPVGFMDLYKKESFILEAKQGSTSTSKKIGTARRGTSGRHLAMHVEAPSPLTGAVAYTLKPGCSHQLLVFTE